MFYCSNEDGFISPFDGIQRKTLVYGQRTLMTEFRFDKGARLPHHSHPNEQTGYLVSGRIRLTVGDEIYTVNSGDAWCIPENVTHGAYIEENAIAIEVFSPLRKDYVPSSPEE